MGCASEHYTRWNRPSFKHLLLQHRLNNIVSRWPARLQQHKNRVHRIKVLVAKRKVKRAHDLKVLKMRRKVRAWRVALCQLGKRSRALRLQHMADRNFITPADWDRLFERSPGKLRAIYHKTYSREQWPKDVPYLNMIALANYYYERFPQVHWPHPVPNLNLRALRDHQEKLWSRVEWPKEVPYLNFKARAEHDEKHWPRAEWPKSVPYLNFVVRAAYEKHFPRADWVEGVPYLDFVALAVYAEKQNAGPERARRTLGFGARPSHAMSWHSSHLAFEHRKEPMYPLPEPQLNDRFHVELFKKRQQDAEYQAEAAKSNAAIEALKHFIAQFDRIKLLLEQSRRDLRSVTVKQWRDAADGTDILTNHLEVAQRMEFSRKLEVGEFLAVTDGEDLVKAFEQMRR